ncbi:MAG: Bax inhibitor-1/YccA family protein [Candidatus Devosia symbiotica]|nr:Bax inhibitor-1/YccA family protein [Candidatus Devosia symbiotica]
MAEFDRQTLGARASSAAAIDEGLRSYMLRVYNYMSIGLVVTGLVAWFAAGAAVTTDPAAAVGTLADGAMVTQFGALLYGSPLQWVVMLAPLAFVMVLSFGINKLSAPAAQATFWGFAAIMGLSLSSIFLVYTDTSIAKVFFITAATFGTMSLYGYTTKRDLTAMNSFLMMGLIGLIIAAVVNIFMQSLMIEFIISVVGVLIFVGLTTYDTQKIKEEYSESYNTEVLAKGAIMGSLRLYLDFINLFLMMLRLFGNRE